MNLYSSKCGEFKNNSRAHVIKERERKKKSDDVHACNVSFLFLSREIFLCTSKNIALHTFMSFI